MVTLFPLQQLPPVPLWIGDGFRGFMKLPSAIADNGAMTRIAVIDFETTGLSPAMGDRDSTARHAPGACVELINPWDFA